jgi:glutamate synthase (NADPH/NADH) small chain
MGDAGIEAVRVQRMRLGAPDASGRRSPEPVPGSSTDRPADLVIAALGFDPEDLVAMFDEPALPVSRWGTLKIDWDTMMTALPGVFAAGDIVRGASLVVWGVRDGRDAAAGIHRYIQSGAQRTAGAAPLKLAS